MIVRRYVTEQCWTVLRKLTRALGHDAAAFGCALDLGVGLGASLDIALDIGLDMDGEIFNRGANRHQTTTPNAVDYKQLQQSFEGN